MNHKIFAFKIIIIIAVLALIFAFGQSLAVTKQGQDSPLNILNVHSHPQQGENWEVGFTTQGRADLKIIPIDQATIDDLDFVSLKCGEESILQSEQLDSSDGVIHVPNWECSEAGSVAHRINIANKHTLKFEFKDKIIFAYNSPDSVTVNFTGADDVANKIASRTNLEVDTGAGQVKLTSVCYGIANNTQVGGCDGTCQACQSDFCSVANVDTDPGELCGTTGCLTGNCKGDTAVCGWNTTGDGNCNACKTCVGATSGTCENHTDGYNDCGAGCQTCLSGSCADDNSQCADSGWNGCSNSYTKTKSNNGICTSDSCGTDSTYVSVGDVCQGGSSVNPSGSTNCGTGAQACYCDNDWYQCDSTNDCTYDQYYVGFNNGASCTESGKVVKASNVTNPSGYRCNTGNTTAYSSYTSIMDTSQCNTTNYCNGNCAYYTGKTCSGGSCSQGNGGGSCTSTQQCSGGTCQADTCDYTGGTCDESCTYTCGGTGSRDTDGTACGSGWRDCTASWDGASTCDESASGTEYRDGCVSGTCTTKSLSQSCSISRDTDGYDCGCCIQCSGGTCSNEIWVWVWRAAHQTCGGCASGWCDANGVCSANGYNTGDCANADYYGCDDSNQCANPDQCTSSKGSGEQCGGGSWCSKCCNE